MLIVNKVVFSIIFTTITLTSQTITASENSQATKNQDLSNKAKKEVDSRIEISNESKQKLIKLLEENEGLHDAFYNYKEENIEKVIKKTETMITAITKALDKIEKNLKADLIYGRSNLEKISSKAKKSENYNHYNAFSTSMIKILTTYNLGDTYNVYSCPMVKKKWIQNSKTLSKVHNPYAPSMPHCGVQDTYFL